ncbi:MAG: flagellar hook-associated protein FlgK, partial [Bdellovibrionota bacterium]
MAIPNVLNTGRSSMIAAKAAISTAGHNVSNTNTEGFSRQRVHTEAIAGRESTGARGMIGRGTNIGSVDRLNDLYLEKQIRNAKRDVSNSEEKEMALRQLEDTFNESNGEGLNSLLSRFFNEFRKLGNQADSEAVRQSVREATSAVVNDFRRIRKEVSNIRDHIDARIEGHVQELNGLANELKDLNTRVRTITLSGGQPNDLLDNRDLVLKKMGTYAELNMYQDSDGNYVVDVVGMGPLVAGSQVEKFETYRSKANENGKPEGSLDIKSSASANAYVTHLIKGGRLGALVNARDETLSMIVKRVDEMAYAISKSVNDVHRVGVTRDGFTGINFFRDLDGPDRAAEFIDLSDDVKKDANKIAAGLEADAPADNRVAVTIAGLQG